MIGTLQEIRNLYSSKAFILGYVGNTIILPKEVTIKEDLTVWNDQRSEIAIEKICSNHKYFDLGRKSCSSRLHIETD